MTEPVHCHIQILDWHDAKDKASAIRRKVFIEEQHVPESLEWDEFDSLSRHALATLRDGSPVACGRLMPTGQLGRMAVLEEWRNRGIGRLILSSIEDEARRLHYRSLFLHAQTQALPFYKRFDYDVVGDVFYEADIPHQKMTKQLA